MVRDNRTNSDDVISDPVLATALDRFKKNTQDEEHNRKAMVEDLEFVYNVGPGQWDAQVRAEREAAGRPCLTSNKLRIHVSNVANKERDQRISGNVRPVDSNGDVRTAELYAGIIRHIEGQSIAQDIYTQAGEYAIAGGVGYCRIVSESRDDSFDQHLRIKLIEDPLSVRLDPLGNWGIVREEMSRAEFKEEYSNANADYGLDSFDSEDESSMDWFDEDNIFVADYYYKEFVDGELVEAVHPVTQELWVIEITDEVTHEVLAARGFQVQRSKKVRKSQVKWIKITGLEVLDSGEWPGEGVPIYECLGDYVVVAGRRHRRSLIRDAKDPQAMYNYALTHNTEIVGLQPKAPYLVTPSQIEGHEPMWRTANQDNNSYLVYNGKPGDRPKREIPPQISQGSTALMQFSAGDIKDATGLREASFGESSGERTGVAIQQRATRSEFNTFHFHDNYKRFISDVIRGLIDVIPHFMDTERIERILGEDGTEQIVTINEEYPDLNNPGETLVFNDMSVGKYDIVQDTKVWSTRRQEMAQGMKDAMKGAPNLAPLVAPELARLEDWPGAQAFADKIEKYMAQLLGGASSPQQSGNPQTGGGIPG